MSAARPPRSGRATTAATTTAATTTAATTTAATTTAATGSGPAVVAALQAALAAENAAVFGYGVAGALMSGAQQTMARRDWVIHEKARDALITLLTGRGVTPVAAAAVYQLPFPVHGPGSAVALAAYLENRVTTAYLGLVALTDPALRAFGARSVEAAALRAAAWQGHTVAFPGLSTPSRARPAVGATSSTSP